MPELSDIAKILLIAGGIYFLYVLTYVTVYAVMIAIILGIGYTLFKTLFLI